MWPFLWNILKPTKFWKYFMKVWIKVLKNSVSTNVLSMKKDFNNIFKLSQIHGIPFLEVHKHNSKRCIIISSNKIKFYLKKI